MMLSGKEKQDMTVLSAMHQLGHMPSIDETKPSGVIVNAYLQVKAENEVYKTAYEALRQRADAMEKSMNKIIETLR